MSQMKGCNGLLMGRKLDIGSYERKTSEHISDQARRNIVNIKRGVLNITGIENDNNVAAACR